MRDYKTDYWREYFRRYHHTHRRKKLLVIYKTQGRLEFKILKKKYNKAYYEKNKKAIEAKRKLAQKKDPQKNRARHQLGYAVRVGKIKRLPCEVCGEKLTQGHHTDYSKPLDVQWLCAKHHGEAERSI